MLARPSLAHADKWMACASLHARTGGGACIFVRTHRGAARVSFQRVYEADAGIFWTDAWGSTRVSFGRAQERCMRLLAHASWGACIFLVHACLGLCSYTRRCRRLEPPCCALLCIVDAGIRAQKMQASGPRRCRRLSLNVCLLAVQSILGCAHVSWLLL